MTRVVLAPLVMELVPCRRPALLCSLWVFLVVASSLVWIGISFIGSTFVDAWIWVRDLELRSYAHIRFFWWLLMAFFLLSVGGLARALRSYLWACGVRYLEVLGEGVQLLVISFAGILLVVNDVDAIWFC